MVTGDVESVRHYTKGKYIPVAHYKTPMTNKRYAEAMPHIHHDRKGIFCTLCQAGFRTSDTMSERLIKKILTDFINDHRHEETKRKKQIKLLGSED